MSLLASIGLLYIGCSLASNTLDARKELVLQGCHQGSEGGIPTLSEASQSATLFTSCRAMGAPSICEKNAKPLVPVCTSAAPTGQGAIAAKPSATYKGYLLGGLCWFAVPFTMATSMGTWS